MRLRVLTVLLLFVSMSCFAQRRAAFFNQAAPAAGGGAGVPGWGGLSQFTSANSGASTTTLYFSNNIPQNARVVIGIFGSIAPSTIDNDSRGNSYAFHTNVLSSSWEMAIGSGNAATAITAGDSVVINWASTTFGYKKIFVAWLTNCTAFDAVALTNRASNTGFANPATVGGSTAAAFGFVALNNTTVTCGVGAGWSIGTHITDADGYGYYPYWANFASSGAKDPAVTQSGTVDTAAVWAAFH